jgi:hypothetical protein
MLEPIPEPSPPLRGKGQGEGAENVGTGSVINDY